METDQLISYCCKAQGHGVIFCVSFDSDNICFHGEIRKMSVLVDIQSKSIDIFLFSPGTHVVGTH